MTFQGLATDFSRLANSPLGGQITFKQGENERMTTMKPYDNLNRLTQAISRMEHQPGRKLKQFRRKLERLEGVEKP